MNEGSLTQTFQAFKSRCIGILLATLGELGIVVDIFVFMDDYI